MIMIVTVVVIIILLKHCYSLHPGPQASRGSWPALPSTREGWELPRFSGIP